ncbi:PREDICTED: uncharacterized protein LOC104810286 [Tarenaya hassleriana]|uniref:uncharacterized protein LOC104810286 n=1 Tax=Tarenaya hassleriana TaxID=28532 RepID=UPI00053C0F3F|nr:PREDICTED: uncharacterized protein LOC104810286 [Tarenaya hassleriana]
MNLGDLNKVWEIKALKKPGEDEARKILEKVAKQVQPIMTRRKWRVKLLSEFCPKNPALLGVNVCRGVHVKLRLRRQNREWDFFSFNEILDTMLHELCHNVHGPHNATFYKLWDELRRECEELIMKGISGTGQGFDLPGKRLGGFTRHPPSSSLRATAAAAAEKRVRAGNLLPSGSHRLGGDSTIMSALSPIQAAAMAAERRLLDDIWCGSHSAEALAEEENGDIHKESVRVMGSSTSSSDNGRSYRSTPDARLGKRSGWSNNNNSLPSSTNHQWRLDVIDLTENGPDTRSPKRCCKPQDAASSSNSSNITCIANESAMWECATCTLLNPPLAPICELCSGARPKDKGVKFKIWSCKFCTLENDMKLEKCEACGQWRYSYGAPLSARAPNLGT